MISRSVSLSIALRFSCMLRTSSFVTALAASIACATSRISRSLMAQRNVFQELHPIDGVRPTPLWRASVGAKRKPSERGRAYR